MFPFCPGREGTGRFAHSIIESCIGLDNKRQQFQEDSVEVPLLRDCHGGEQLITGERTNYCSYFVP